VTNTYTLRDAAFAAHVPHRDAREWVGNGAFQPTLPRARRKWLRLTEADCVLLAIVGVLRRYGFDPAEASEIIAEAGDNPLIIRASRARGRTIVRGATDEPHHVTVSVLAIEAETRERLPYAAALRTALPRAAAPRNATPETPAGMAGATERPA